MPRLLPACDPCTRGARACGLSPFIPAVVHLMVGASGAVTARTLGLEIANVVILTYVLSPAFALRTHEHLYVGEAGEHTDERTHGAGGTRNAVVLWCSPRPLASRS